MAIDLMEAALAINGGDPVTVNIGEIKFNIKRNYSAKQVRKYVKVFNDAENTWDKIINEVLNITCSFAKDKDKEEVAEQLLELSIAEVTKVIVFIGETAGLMNHDGELLSP